MTDIVAGTGFITAAMVAAQGRELDRLVSYPIAASDIRRWAMAVYHPEPPPSRFWDAPGDGDPIAAPEEFNPFAWMVAEPVGRRPGFVPGGPTIEAKLGLPEIATAHMLNGGTAISYHAPMRVGDEITSVTVLDSYREREGRHGPMLFTLTVATWTNQRGETIKVVTNTLIRY